MDAYLGWKKRQDAPRAISAEIFGLCRAPSLAEMKFAESVHGKDLRLGVPPLCTTPSRRFLPDRKP